MIFPWPKQLPRCGNWTPASVPPPARAGQFYQLLFLPLVPLSYWVLRDSIYSFPLVRYSRLLSPGVLHTLLCLKVYLWCICGERRTPHPLTPLPSCPFFFSSFIWGIPEDFLTHNLSFHYHVVLAIFFFWIHCWVLQRFKLFTCQNSTDFPKSFVVQTGKYPYSQVTLFHVSMKVGDLPKHIS